MNVDEAMELFGPGKKKFWTLQSGDHFNAGETLACEVERLRAELAETKAESVGLEEGHHRLEAALDAEKANSEALKKALLDLQAAAIRLGDRLDDAEKELAAAKAASVCPEESVIWLLAVAAKLEKDGEASGLDSMTKAANWLRDRMKERGEQ